MGQAERTQERPDIAAQASARYGSRGVPADWFLDPADPSAADRYREGTRLSLEDQATAFLTAHEALVDLPDVEEGPSSLLVLPRLDPDASELAGVQEVTRSLSAPPAQPAWIGLPIAPGNIDDDGELSWQADSLCAQTDPEAFFPEKGGSTRDAKKVCGSCMVRSECLEYALENDERFGIWGGLSERERRRLRKRAV
ncbi:WhiB family transcriptional regulator [Arthrobacter agilis]|uniref:WhiB family transcriptional regulator n=1 Tax=Arthrobacter agilis TaxID=37921 RepID=UPI000B354DD0|nr:WhiB family transcriptional regulator [Arthrobacter agilis]PPB45132.1 WhiB family transcriptional regulator [Arthrobacter agilis]TPV27833.1 WhiB family transcriptional regulator [Arthrobacter agilis]WDF34232.1 WhiB family transcriptional regulator [Arthrobacter agilis]VDR31505.1 Transcription factor WhiB [Arthrobacter agilis]